MAESTLALALTDLQSAVGFFLGFGAGSNFGDPAWTNPQTIQINRCIASGLRQFYFPNPPYDWSFMAPVTTVVLPDNTSEIQMPDDFGGLDGVITLINPTTQCTWALRTQNEGAIREMYQVTPQAVGRPVAVAVRALRGTAATQGQRSELYFFPISDQEYNVQVKYYINPDALTPANPYPYGGMMHAETIRAAVLAAAEETLDDTQDTWAQKFQQRLMASVNVDRRSKPQVVGYNGDRSDLVGRWRRSDWHGWGSVAVNGQVPGAPGL